MAVYTRIDVEELEEFLFKYEIGEVVSYTGIAEGVENTNYLLQTTEGNFILTIYEKRVNPSDLPFFMNLMRHLASNGVSCPEPVCGKDGNPLQKINGRFAAVTTFLKGTSPRRITPEHCAGLGKAMAEMHVATSSFEGSRANSLYVKDWRPLFMSCAYKADEISKGMKEEIETELLEVEESWPDNLPSGVIHADLFPDNVFFLKDSRSGNNKVSGLIDFYFSCNGFFAYDIAICLNAWCFENDCSFNITKARKFVSAYQAVRKMETKEIESLPLLARGSALRFLLTRLYDWINTPENALVRPKDPKEYLKKLRFHKGLESAGAYCIDS